MAGSSSGGIRGREDGRSISGNGCRAVVFVAPVAPPRAVNARQVSSGVLAFAALVTALTALLTPYSPSIVVWAALLIPFLLLNADRLQFAGWLLFVAAMLAAVAGAVFSGTDIGPAMTSAGFLFALLVVLQALGRVASQSRIVIRGAEIILSRSPGSRYLMLTFGTHLFTIFLNVGSVILIMSMLGPRVRDSDDGIVRPLALAVVRGFAAASFWSPLSLSMIVLLSLIDGIPYYVMAPLGLASAAVYLFAGHLLDARKAGETQSGTALTRADVGTLSMITAGVAGLVLVSYILVLVLGIRLIEAVFISAFIATLVWVGLLKLRGAQQRKAPGIVEMLLTAPRMTNEIAIICGSVTIGTVASAAIPHWHAQTGDAATILFPLLAAAIPWVLVAFAFLAINPLVSGTIVAGVLNTAWPESAKLFLLLTIVWGWAAAASSSAFNVNVRLVALAVNRTPFKVAIPWNFRLTAVSCTMSGLACALGTYLST